MKSAALIFGVIAGLLGAGALVLGNLDSSLAAVAALGPDRDAIAKLIAYLVPAVCWLGAGLALGYPRLGALVLLLTAAAWAGIAYVVGHGAVFFAAAPFTFAAAGGLVALFARRTPKPVAHPPIRSADVDGVIFEAVAAAQPNRRRGEPTPPRTIPMRADPRLVPAGRDESGAADRPAARMPPPFQDSVPDEEPTQEPAPADTIVPAPGTFLPAENTEPSIAAAEAENLPAVVPAPTDGEIAAAPGPHPRRPGDWTLPTPAAAAPPATPRYAADRQPAGPSRVEPIAPAAPPAVDQRPRGVSALDFGATNDFSARRDGTSGRGDFDADAPAPRAHFGRRQDTDEAPAFKPDADAKSRRGGGVRRVVRLLIALLFILVLLGIAAAVYLDYRRGAQSILFGRHPHLAATTATTTGTSIGTPPVPPAPASSGPVAPSAPPTPSPASHPTPQPAAIPLTPPPPTPAITASTPTAPTEAPTTPIPLAPPAPTQLAPAAPATPAATAEPAPTPPAAIATAPTPPAIADNTASTASFTDPNAYCAAIGNAEAPDARYTGPAVPAAVATALLVSQSTPADQVHWRCANGAAFACNAHHTNACMATPTVDGMLKYCALHPGATNLPAPNGSWSCNGTRPVIPEDQSWPVDPQGFFPGAWIRVSPAG